QTIDPDDFVHYTGMSKWMRHYEHMVNSFVDIMFINSEEMLSYMTAAGWDVPVCVSGLPFGKQEVLDRAEFIDDSKTKCRIPWEHRKKLVVFASRIADEKQPAFLVAVARAYKQKHPDVVFKILSGG